MTATGNQQGTFEDGLALAMWLEAEVRPQLRKWAKSYDKRVKLMAAMLSDLVESRYAARDWEFLDGLHKSWAECEAKARSDDGSTAE